MEQNKKDKLRVLDTKALSAAENMALDEAILEAREENSIPDTIRFLSFEPHCVLTGFFQNVENEIRESYCKQEGIEINRRITGGGSLYWGVKDIGWEIFASSDRFAAKILKFEDYYSLFCTAASLGINNFGLKSAFRPRNDIEIDGKKISGSGGTSIRNCFMFQGTLLVDINLEIMLRALRVPVEKLKYREINSLKDRITWLSRELGYCPSRNEIIKKLLEGFSQSLGIDYYLDELSPREKELFQGKIGHFKSRDHIYRIKDRKSVSIIKSISKAESGVIRCSASIDIKRKILKTVNFTGDFFIYPSRAIFDLESALKNIPIGPGSTRQDENKNPALRISSSGKTVKIINDFYKNYPQPIRGVTPEHLSSAVLKCIGKLEFKKHLIPKKYYNDIFIIETAGNRTSAIDTTEKIGIFLLPYCAKLPQCGYRFLQGCDFCGSCSIGDIIELLDDFGIKSMTITSYEHLEETLKLLKASGTKFFGGCCCEAFYIKHKQDFEDIGLPGILINIGNNTCYDLGKEKNAHEGNFEGFTEIKLPLVKRILEIYNPRKNKGNKKQEKL